MLLALIFGAAFGAIMHFAGVNRYDTISGMSTLEDFTIAKVMASAIAIGAVLISAEVAMGAASFHIKPVLLGGIVWGGLMFGVGMAVLGYCPGTLTISMGEGSVDAVFGLIGGMIFAAFVFLAFLITGKLFYPSERRYRKMNGKPGASSRA